MKHGLFIVGLLSAMSAWAGRDGLDVLCIYYPEWHVYPEGEAIFGKGRTEWDYVDSAKPRFPGHEQPLKLLDGHPDDANPADVAKEIAYAADAGIDCFVYDWYWADGHPIQHEALERGFLKAPNRRRLKFALMWANHWRSDVFRTAPGKCNDRFWWKLKYDRVEFLQAIDYCIAHYFNQPEYYRKDGKVFLSIYSAHELVKGLGGPEKAKAVFAEAQTKMKAAGLPPLHLSAMVRWAGGAKAMAAAGFDSVSAYNITPYDFDDSQVKAETGEKRQLFTHEEFAALHETFNAKIAAGSPVPYIPVVSRGWDPSPRCRPDEPFPWRTLWYPYLGIIKDLSPDCFAKSVAFAKRQAENDPKKPGAILINAWNEYTEGSYLMPDEKNGDAYLKALRRVLAKPQTAFVPLAPGKVRPTGWLRDWSLTTRDGYTGHLDDIDRHFQLAWTTNCMRRGANLSWVNAHDGSWSAEGGAYWFDGLVRLAWQLDDPQLKAYAKSRLDTVLDRMNPNAILFVHWMDRTNPDHMKEIRAANEAWIGWAAAILGRAIAGYYQASGDERALRALNWAFNDVRFFEYGNGKPVVASAWEAYQLGRDPVVSAALDAWCEKGPDFGHIVWRYARRPEPEKVEFRPFTSKNHDWRAQHGVLACETAISALRASYWPKGKADWRESVLAWSSFLRTHALQPYGVPVADESWGYAGADRGTETCTVAADIRLQIELLRHLSDGRFGDNVERALFNAGAACTTADFNKHVYVQTPNRTVVENRADFTCPATARYYRYKNWPLCCTAALTRYLPDFVQHLWMASSDGGAVATLYGPCTAELETGSGVKTVFRETTVYPFEDSVRIAVSPEKPTAFPLRVRIPSWCEEPAVLVNGEKVSARPSLGFAVLSREWHVGDTVVLRFPMKPVVTCGRDRNKGDSGKPWCAVSAGPLLFARNLPGTDENTLAPGAETNLTVIPAEVASRAVLTRRPMPAKWKWLPELAPVRVTIPTALGSVELVPYGSTLLRLSMFDVAFD